MTTKVGIIGWPLSHTLSPAMHNAVFQALGMDWKYDAMAIPPDIVRLGIREPMQHGYIGINVTIPHKETVMKFVRPDEIAKSIGAVNTIDFRNNSGTNTDVTGLVEDLKAHDVSLQGTRAIVLGAGGAARAAVYGLWREGAQVIVVNRTLERARTMLANMSLQNLQLKADVLTLDEAAEQGGGLIVNCTSAGMSPDVEDSAWLEGVPFPYGATVYDMVYRPAKTKLMTLAESNGGHAIGGLGMLVRQGAAAFELWTGRPAPVEVMFEVVRAELAKEQGI
jgi:shikimate dehydrogenase